MPQRKAKAIWRGDLKSGGGRVTFAEGVCDLPYSFKSRFEEGKGTNPEELIGAAHAGCFSMALSGVLAEAGHEPKAIETEATVTVEKCGDGFEITRIHLAVEAEVPGLGDDEFLALAEEAKKNCPVSKLLAGAEIDLDAGLLG